MSFEKDIKDAFARHADDAQPGRDAWNEVEQRVRRSHARRTAAATAFAVVLIAAAAVAVPRLTVDRTPNGFTNDPSTSATPSAGPDTSGWKPRAMVNLWASVSIPPDWKGGWFEGHWDFQPKDLPSAAEGGETFFVEFAQERASRLTCGEPQRRRIGDRDAIACGSAQQRTIEYMVEEWHDGASLVVRIMASSDDLWERYIATANDVIDTVMLYDGARPIHSTLDGSVPVDDYTKTLVRFMDARVEGVTADLLVCCEAAETYTPEVLYGDPEGDGYIVSYSIQNRRAAGASRMSISVSYSRLNGDTSTDGMGEDVVIGRERPGGPLMIVDATLTGDGA